MDLPSWSLQDAKNSFSAVVDAALEGTPQFVTRRGKPAVVVVSAEDYERLTEAQNGPKPSFVEHLLAMPQGGDDEDFARLDLTPRDVEF